jgi:hypothetical protein
MTDKYIVMTWLESLHTLYEYLITAMETMVTWELAIEYLMERLIHKISKAQEEGARR